MIKVIQTQNKKIKINFSYNPEYVEKIRQIRGAWYHPREKCWSLEDSDLILTRFFEKFKGVKIELDPKLAKRAPAVEHGFGAPGVSYHFNELKRELNIRCYSPKTYKAYLRSNEELVKHANKLPQSITETDIKNYLNYLVTDRKLKPGSLDLVDSALRFYYIKVLKRNLFADIPRPKREKKLPVTLNDQEVALIIGAVTNIKHRTLLMVAYSAGLRVGEIIRLKLHDIDMERKLIHIKSAKGKKDRYTPLAQTALEMIRIYCKFWRPRHWLFPGQNKDTHICVRTAEKIFENAVSKAGITKKVSIHSLRHAFGTHMMDKNVELRYIQEIMGHKHSKTTEIYTHVSNKDISQLDNPLDRLNKKFNILD
jgi:site-specific recombinase XerD